MSARKQETVTRSVYLCGTVPSDTQYQVVVSRKWYYVVARSTSGSRVWGLRHGWYVVGSRYVVRTCVATERQLRIR